MTKAYSEAAVEVLDIINHTAEEKVNLIPIKFINYLKENAAEDYNVNLDYSKPITEMGIKTETMGILGTICRNWWWTDEQKQEYSRLVREKEMKLQEALKERYNADDIFKEKIKENVTEKNVKKENTTSMVEYKENIFTRILNFIKKLIK